MVQILIIAGGINVFLKIKVTEKEGKLRKYVLAIWLAFSNEYFTDQNHSWLMKLLQKLYYFIPAPKSLARISLRNNIPSFFLR